MPTPDADAALRRDLDRCVKCGLCLPECPTYRLSADEGESPRGRLALIDGLVTGRLDGDRAVVRHIDSCLTCRRCERICPSRVPYGRVVDAARARLSLGMHPLSRLAQRPGAMRVFAALSRRLPSRLTRPFGALHGVHRGIRALGADRPPPAPGIYSAATDPARARVGLFAGCTGDALQADAQHAATRLLRRAGCDVEIPPRATCCGALAAHGGDPAAAAAAATATRAAFATDVGAIVSIASGCGIHLDAYQPPLTRPHYDVCHWLLEHGGLRAQDFDRLDARVALHVPCSVENVYQGTRWADRLLRLIPGIDVVHVGETGQCCGAAGDHMLRDPARAAALRAPVLSALAGRGVDVLVTSNIGCALHLAAGIAGQGMRIDVIHPVELLARQLV